MNHKILNEDCRKYLDRSEVCYDYLLTSPPDYMEVGLSAKKGHDTYREFLSDCYRRFNPKGNIATLLMTDKKKDSQVYTKHITNIEIMRSLGWTLRSEKLWVRRMTQNAYEMTFSFILTFVRGPHSQNNHKSYGPDLYLEKRDPGIRKYSHRHIGMNSFPASIGERFVLNFTQPGDVVCDPFMGIGGTAISALRHGRSVVGSELDTETHRLLMKRLHEEFNGDSTLDLWS